MEKSNIQSIFLFMFCIINLLIHTECNTPLLSKKKTTLFVFGASAFDVGNNNHINITDIGKANYFPYGETFFKYPTGRFSDGRLIPDFITEYAKLPLIPPYLAPGNHAYTYGANFASAGAGALLETRQGLVIDLKTQLSYFKNVSRLWSRKLGDEEATNLLSRAVYLFSIGGNDYTFLFDTNSSLLRSFSHEQIVGLVIGNISSVIEEIYKIGGRKFGFKGVNPIACMPYRRILAGDKNGGKCFDQITPYVELHNQELSKLLQKLQKELKGFKFSLLESQPFLQERMDHPSKYGFKEGKVACCGSGPYRGIFSCGGRRGVKEYHLCDNVSEYVFFDSAHPTERVYQQFARQAWSGQPRVKGSYNLKALFEPNT